MFSQEKYKAISKPSVTGGSRFVGLPEAIGLHTGRRLKPATTIATQPQN
jgi:hypothetical protein